MNDLAIGQCDTCNELTPQVQSTAGACCQVCFNTNSYSLERVFQVMDHKWLATFWQAKYISLKKPIPPGAGVLVPITVSGTGFFFNTFTVNNNESSI